jgi:hypothetical protein
MVYRTADVLPRRLHPHRADIRAIGPDDRAYRHSLTDEVAIDFPSASAAADAVRRLAADAEWTPVVDAQLHLEWAQAARGALVALPLDLRHTCPGCGGRGEVWDDPCVACCGDGDAVVSLSIDVRVPPGTRDGDRLRFAVTPRRGPRTRVDVRVAVASRP